MASGLDMLNTDIWHYFSSAGTAIYFGAIEGAARQGAQIVGTDHVFASTLMSDHPAVPALLEKIGPNVSRLFGIMEYLQREDVDGPYCVNNTNLSNHASYGLAQSYHAMHHFRSLADRLIIARPEDASALMRNAEASYKDIDIPHILYGVLTGKPESNAVVALTTAGISILELLSCLDAQFTRAIDPDPQ